MTTPQVEVYIHAEREGITDALAESLAAALNRMLPELLARPQGPDHVLSSLPVVEISIVDDETIAAVHAEFLNDPTPTDAITFPYGEILVSCDTARRYAAEHGLDAREELFRYMVHGLVHLHGYRDYEPQEREAMFAVQEPLVAKYRPA
ncbi:MAG: rRNA maturation RNase YbeY [Akkermansia sp.]|nr:rRNA maturation RNase YbeY [Akkermansia sp.]